MEVKNMFPIDFDVSADQLEKSYDDLIKKLAEATGKTEEKVRVEFLPEADSVKNLKDELSKAVSEGGLGLDVSIVATLSGNLKLDELEQARNLLFTIQDEAKRAEDTKSIASIFDNKDLIQNGVV